MPASVLGKIPLGQFALTDGVAGAIIYLASMPAGWSPGRCSSSTEGGLRNDRDHAADGRGLRRDFRSGRLGGRLASFRVGDHELLAAHGHDVFHSGSFVMAPWLGRLRDARLNYGGAQYRFTANNSGPHALHGLVTDRPWRVTGDGELSIELGDPWPWPCRVVQRTELCGAGDFPHRGACTHGHAGGGRLASLVRPPSGRDAGIGRTRTRREAGVDVGQRRHRPAQRRVDQTGAAALGLLLPRPSRRPGRASPGELELTVSSDCEEWVFDDKEDAAVCIEPWTAPLNSLNMPNPRKSPLTLRSWP